MYDRTQGDFGWTQLTIMPTSRSYCTGGVVRNSDSSVDLVITGGSMDLTSDIYSLSTGVNTSNLEKLSCHSG